MDLARFAELNRPDHSRVITKRFVLYVGFKCNLRCQFCYYLKSLEEGTATNESYETLAKKIRVARRFGKTEIDFTGGEATIHPDFTKLLALCKELGFTTINVITNGWKLADKVAFQRFVEAGLNEVLFSLHSSHAETHDDLTRTPRSHERILKAIENAKALGVRVRINSVINPLNFMRLDEHLEFIASLAPKSVNLIVFNPTEETVGYSGHESVRITSYDRIGQAISGALGKYRDRFEVINVRFLPFCYAKGFEEHLRTYWQEIYESQEWDPLLHWAFRKNWLFVGAAIALGRLVSLFQRSLASYGRTDLYTRACEWFQLLRTKVLFRQMKGCASCSLRLICPGLPKEFVKAFPNVEAHPYTARELPLALNPVAFGYRYPEKFPAIAPSKLGFPLLARTSEGERSSEKFCCQARDLI